MPHPPKAAPPPLCPGLPLLGHAHRLFSDPAALLVDAHRQFGGVFRLRALWKSVVVVAGDTARAFMAEGLDDQHLTRYPIFAPLEREFGKADFVMAHSGERHTRLRAPLAVAFSRQVASPFVPQLVDVVRRGARARPTGRRAIVTDLASRMAFAQWCRLLGSGGQRLGYEDCRRLSTYWLMVGATLLPPAIFRVPWYRSAHRRAFAVFQDLVREARRTGPVPGVPTGIVETLLAARDSSGAPLTDDEAVTYLAYGTLGACAYVSRLTAFMLYEILRNPALIGDLRAESRHVFDQGVHEASDLRRLRLLQSVYHETLRRHPVSPGMPFIVRGDFDYMGTRFRRGEAILLSPVPLSFSPEWFAEPERFDPGRCREPRNEHRGGHCHPFGLGNRTCVAGGLVEVMAITLVASLIDELEITPDPADYQLSLTVRPLPAPSRRFGVRIGGTPARPTAGLPPPAPSEEDRLAAFVGHDDPAVVAALARAEGRRFAPGTVIVREGDPSDAYHVLQAGAVIVVQGDPPTQIASLGPGDGFGEVGLLQNAPRNATVIAGPAGADTLALDRDAFLTMVATSDFVAGEIRSLMRKRLASNRLRTFAPALTADAVARVLPDFTWVSYEPGAVIVREGDPAESFFVLVEGEVDVSRRGLDGVDRPVARLGPGEYFGEVGLLRHAPRNATVAASSGGPVSVLRTDRPGFDRLLNQTGGTGTELARAMLACVERLEGR